MMFFLKLWIKRVLRGGLKNRSTGASIRENTVVLVPLKRAVIGNKNLFQIVGNAFIEKSYDVNNVTCI